MKRYPAFNDQHKIWFGRYNEEWLKDVPAGYLLWWKGENEDKLEDFSKVVAADNKKIEQFPLRLQGEIKLYNYIYNCQEAFRIESRQ
jgi:hypothetical protein